VVHACAAAGAFAATGRSATVAVVIGLRLVLFGLVWFVFFCCRYCFSILVTTGGWLGWSGRGDELRRIQKPHEKFLIHQHPLLFFFLSLFSVLLLYKSLTVFGLVAPLLVAPLSLSVCSSFFSFLLFSFFFWGGAGGPWGEKERLGIHKELGNN
jgi:hypothetical protein